MPSSSTPPPTWRSRLYSTFYGTVDTRPHICMSQSGKCNTPSWTYPRVQRISNPYGPYCLCCRGPPLPYPLSYGTSGFAIVRHLPISCSLNQSILLKANTLKKACYGINQVGICPIRGRRNIKVFCHCQVQPTASFLHKEVPDALNPQTEHPGRGCRRRAPNSIE